MHATSRQRLHGRGRVGRRATLVLWWSTLSALAGVTGWMAALVLTGSHHVVLSGDLLGLDAAIAVLGGFIVGAAQVGVLTAHHMVDEAAATRYWISMTVAWTLTWPAWLVAASTFAVDPRLVPGLPWQALPWLIVSTLSGAWLLVHVPDARSVPPEDPDGGGGGRTALEPAYLQCAASAIREQQCSICVQRPAAVPSSGTFDGPKVA